MSEIDDRTKLFQRLTRGLDYTEKKIYDKKKKDEGLRLRWVNTLVKLVNGYGRLLETEELELRIEKLEKQIGDAVIIPNEDRKQKNTRFRR